MRILQNFNVIVVFGLGSMGKRRVRILLRRFPGILLLGIDLNDEKRKAFEDEFGLQAFGSLDEVLAFQPKAAIVSTSPLSHAEIVTECLKHGLHVFTEINLTAAGYEKNIELARRVGKVLFLSSTFLYRREICYIREQIKKTKHPLDYSYHVGQYLPDWHPWEAYRSFFVAKKESNACRELFAIELPWLTAAFGAIESMQAISDKISSLELPYHDNYFVMVRHRNGHKGILIVDVVSRDAVRDFSVFGEELFLRWDGTPTGIWKKDLEANVMRQVSLYEDEQVVHDDNYSRNVIENSYDNEICAFVDTIQGIRQPEYGYVEDMVTLRWLDKLEEGMK